MGKLTNLSWIAAGAIALAGAFLLPEVNAQALRGSGSKSTPATQRITPASELKIPGMKMRSGVSHNTFGSNPSLLEALKAGKVKPAMAPMKVAGSGDVVYGCLVYSDDYYARNMGIYTFALDGTNKQTLVESNILANGGGTYANGKYYYMEYGAYDGEAYYYTFIFDAETWDILKIGDGDASVAAHDMDYDPVTNKIYGSFYGQNGTEWGVLDMENYTRTTIATMNPAVHTVSFNASGQAYGVGFDGNLYKIDKNTGATTLVGPTGVVSQYESSSTFDKATGKLYYAHAGEYSSGLYEINTATGAATLISKFVNNEEICGMYFPEAVVSPTAPARIEDLALDFAPGSLSGNLTFTLPTKTFGGGNLTGNINYTVSMDGQRINLGADAPGAKVSVPVSVPVSGEYNFIVNTTNVGGSGQATYLNGYIGYAAPVAPKNVSLSYENDKFYLEWQGSTTAATEGAFTASDVTYTVRRYPGGEVAAQDLRATRFEEEAQIAGSSAGYYYTVEAVNHDAHSKATQSNSMTLQIIQPPYTDNFVGEESLDAWTIYNLTGNRTSWKWRGDPGKPGYVQIQGVKDYAKDDWAFSPGIRFEAGNAYEIAIDAWIWNTKWGSEYLTLVISTEPTDEGIVETIVPKTEVTVLGGSTVENPGVQLLSGEFMCTRTGTYYVGIHAEAAPDAWMINFNNFRVGAPQIAASPAAVEDLTVTPDANGAMSAVVSFTTPTVAKNGSTLTDIDVMTVKRDGQVVKTFEKPATGTALSFTDTGMTQGVHTYSVIGSNSAGDGNAATETVFIGINVPAAPESVNVKETANDGEVTVSWPAVVNDRDGRALNTQNVTYMVADGGQVIASNVTGTSHTFQAVPANGNQQFVSYTVYAMTNAGRSTTGTQSELVPVGPAYPTPYIDSFKEGGYTHLHNVTPANSPLVWRIYSVDEMQLETPDGDNYMLGARGNNVDQTSMWSTGKIKLADNVASSLSFYYFAMTENENTLDVMINDGDGWKSLGHYVMGSPQGWRKVTIHLNDYKGKSVQFGFKGTLQTYTTIMIDGIVVDSLPDVNLTAEGIHVPSRFDANTPVDIEVDITNNGALPTSDYKVVLYRNNREVATAQSVEIASGETKTVTISETAPVTETRVTYYAEIVCDDDEDPLDNTTYGVTASVVVPNYPAPTQLAASKVENSVELTWNAADLGSQLPDAITDDFESYEAFALNKAGDWTFIDADGSKTYGFEGIDFPHAGEPMAYIVFNNEGSQFDNFFNTTSGHQFMATFVTYGGQNDDWMISPRLYGKAQKVSFFAKSFSNTYGYESFEILYSTTTRAKDAFTHLDAVGEVPTEWTEYSFEVPNNTRYVAIRCTSANRMMFMVDDFTYVPYGAEIEPLTLVGYNIYRDNVKMNSAVVTTNTFSDAQPESDDNMYCVTAIYDRGESAPSNFVSINSSGVEPVAGADIRVYTVHNQIVIDGAAGQNVGVYGLDGRSVFNDRSATNRISVSVVPGVYVVKAGAKVVKVIVK